MIRNMLSLLRGVASCLPCMQHNAARRVQHDMYACCICTATVTPFQAKFICLLHCTLCLRTVFKDILALIGPVPCAVTPSTGLQSEGASEGRQQWQGVHHSLTLWSHGISPCVTFEPPSASLGPMLPSTTETINTQVTMRNDSDYALEVFSLDYNTQHLAEEAALREYSGDSAVDDLLR